MMSTINLALFKVPICITSILWMANLKFNDQNQLTLYLNQLWAISVKANFERFFIICLLYVLCLYMYCLFIYVLCLYMYCCWRSSYQEERVGIQLTSLTLLHFCACPKPGSGFPTKTMSNTDPGTPPKTRGEPFNLTEKNVSNNGHYEYCYIL
jgi:hypothetical protein